MKTVLITGGAGFIGSELVKSLHAKGCKVKVVDSLIEQVHGANPPETSATFSKIQGLCEFYHGDVRDREFLKKALAGVDTLVHLAAETGTGQSMYAISTYCDSNIQGTAILLEEALAVGTITKYVVASSRAVYGEGKYNCQQHGSFYPGVRQDVHMAKAIFDPPCPQCGVPGEVVPTTEDSPVMPQSIYGITKLAQEELVLKTAAAAGTPAVALRFQNVYGPGQSLSNPYTGILSIFSTRAKDNKSINIFEDGEESRDFVFIDDVVNSLMLAVFFPEAGQQVFNVGAGRATTVKQVVESIVSFFASKSEVAVSGAYRVGDIRHNIADLHKIETKLGYKPTVKFEDGVRLFLDWAVRQDTARDSYEKSLAELQERGLLKK